ncbi:MAG: hypothetical protein ACK5PG_17465 [Lysobacterales bacterium]|jgi:ABC-type spermidine/putrescine transport system permease subunit I
MTINEMLDYLIGGLLLTMALFWILFFFIVIPRLTDEKAMPKKQNEGLSFLWRRVPTAELDAYAALLSEEEKRRWYNRVLVQPVSSAALIACLSILISIAIASLI